MSKSMSFEQIKKFLKKEKAKYEKQEATKARREAAKNERAVAKLAKMGEFSLYSDDKFDISELDFVPSYQEGGRDAEWN